jgi:hypothetical protein
MVQIASKTRIPLDDDWDMYVVSKGPNQPVILSVVSHGAVEERFSIHLKPAQATRAAMALASVTGRSVS